jgi:hypothetical protein
MAAITSNVVWRTMQLRNQLNAVLSHCREMLDAFVSNSMRLAAAKAGHARPRQSRSAFPFPPALQAEASDMRFAPLDPDVLSETIPAFYIGRNKAGLWVARDAKGADRGNLSAEELSAVLRAGAEPATAMRDDLSLWAIRTRPRQCRQSARAAACVDHD